MSFTFQAGKATSVLLLTLAISAQVRAQGLGDIKLDSALHQPLRAHIDLLDVAKLDSTQVKVALATQAEYDRAGIQRGAVLTQLKFDVQIDKSGTGRILISSGQDIGEPFLNFLIGVSWPSGRTLREYTLLLDLPQERAGGATAPAVSGARSAGPAATAAQGESSHEVKAGETLYQIATTTRPNQDVSVPQMMIAIQRANEDAFVNNNVNRILTGKVLRIPRMDEIRLIDQEAAQAQITQQNTELGAETLAVNDAASAPKQPARDELTLLSGNQEGAATGSNDLDATIKALESQLMVSEEGLDRARLENLELTNRLSAVQEQIDLLQNIIAIEDERIAQLQKQLGVQSAATADALARVEQGAANGGEEEGGLVALLSNSVVMLGALLAVALGVAGMLFVRRRNAQAALVDDDASLDTLADTHADDEEEGSGGFRAFVDSLLARFRRRSADDTDDEDDEVTLSEAAVTAAAPAVVSHPLAAPEPAKSVEDDLLEEMGLGQGFMSLDSALDAVEQEQPQKTAAEPVAALPVEDSAIAEAGTLMQEASLLDQALDAAEEDAPEEDFLQAPAETVAAAPETFAFTTEPVAEPEPQPVEPVGAEDAPEVFEFTLPNLEESLAAAADELQEAGAGKASEEESKGEKLETISFDGASLLSAAAPEPAEPATDDGLEVLSFDDTSIQPEDEVTDEAAYSEGSGADTHDARLDLAVAYEAMGDLDGAVEILDEVIASGRSTQIEEARRLKQKWQHS